MKKYLGLVSLVLLAAAAIMFTTSVLRQVTRPEAQRLADKQLQDVRQRAERGLTGYRIVTATSSLTEKPDAKNKMDYLVCSNLTFSGSPQDDPYPTVNSVFGKDYDVTLNGGKGAFTMQACRHLNNNGKFVEQP